MSVYLFTFVQQIFDSLLSHGRAAASGRSALKPENPPAALIIGGANRHVTAPTLYVIARFHETVIARNMPPGRELLMVNISLTVDSLSDCALSLIIHN